MDVPVWPLHDSVMVVPTVITPVRYAGVSITITINQVSTHLFVITKAGT